jgi:hypothetical protein
MPGPARGPHAAARLAQSLRPAASHHQWERRASPDWLGREKARLRRHRDLPTGAEMSSPRLVSSFPLVAALVVMDEGVEALKMRTHGPPCVNHRVAEVARASGCAAQRFPRRNGAPDGSGAVFSGRGIPSVARTSVAAKVLGRGRARAKHARAPNIDPQARARRVSKPAAVSHALAAARVPKMAHLRKRVEARVPRGGGARAPPTAHRSSRATHLEPRVVGRQMNVPRNMLT